jgi:hypothetical protein
MLIPTQVWGHSTLANPGTDYWAKTAAHFYINAPGIGAEEACVWGTKDKDVGNWAPFVAGTNTDDSGQTFIKLGWNPIYLEADCPFKNKMPDWGVSIECPDGNCNGLPCAIDPQENSVNEMRGAKANGAGGGSFCVVTVPKGSTANFVITGGSGGWSSGGPHEGGWQDDSGSSSTSTYATSSTTFSTAEWSAATWSTGNETSSTTSWEASPTHRPNKDLFNTDAASSSIVLPSSTTVANSTRPAHTPALATGAASTQELSMAHLFLGAVAAAALF